MARLKHAPLSDQTCQGKAGNLKKIQYPREEENVGLGIRPNVSIPSQACSVVSARPFSLGPHEAGAHP